MNIIPSNILSTQQIEEITAFEKQCNDFENLKNKAFLLNEINHNKDLPCFYLAYEEHQLVAFLTTFMPQAHEAEIIAFTHPSFRGQGYFTALFSSAKDMMKKANMTNVLFCIEPHSKSASAVLKKFEPFELERSEYRLIHSGDIKIPESPNLITQLVNQNNKDICLKLTDIIFNMGEDENDNFIENAIQSPNRDAFIAFLKDEPIGVYNLNYEDSSAYLYGLGIDPSHQHKGYGKQLLGLALREGFKIGDKVVLDVDSNNPPAYNLYIHN